MRGLFTVTVVLLTLVILGVSVEQVSANSWGNFDVRTEKPKDITAEDIRKVYKKYGHDDSPLYDLIDWVMEEAEEYGINPLYFLAKINWESSWGKSRYVRDYNNFGGVGGSKPHKFESHKAGITANIQLLVKYTNGEIGTSAVPKGTKMTTIADVLKVYCPTSDGCNHNSYINGIGNIMGWFGQTPDGSLMSGASKDVIEEKAKTITDAGGRIIPLEEIYIDRGVAQGYHAGVSKGDGDFVDASKANWLYTFSEGTQKWMFRIGWVMTAFLIGYMSLYILAFVSVARGSHFQKYFPEKVLDESGEVVAVGLKGSYKAIGRMVIAIVLITLFGTGIYIDLMAFIMNFVIKIM